MAQLKAAGFSCMAGGMREVMREEGSIRMFMAPVPRQGKGSRAYMMHYAATDIDHVPKKKKGRRR
jgi:hypothetical protein